MIDLHCHVLPGIDDGPETIEQSAALARTALAAGTSTMVATPHVSHHYRNSPQTIADGVKAVNARLQAEAIRLEVVPGAEIAVTHLIEIAPAQLERLGLGGSQWLLVEPPFTASATGIDAILLDLRNRGHRILLAHPERCPAFHRDPRLLEAIVQAGALTSITAGALIGRFGEDVRRFALQLVDAEMVHNVASDAHDLKRRPPEIAGALEQTGLAPLADWLTEAVPAAILENGDTIPPRPAGGQRPHRPRERSGSWIGRRLRRAS
jgi:protein-tyrosine phosphatase